MSCKMLKYFLEDCFCLSLKLGNCSIASCICEFIFNNYNECLTFANFISSYNFIYHIDFVADKLNVISYNIDPISPNCGFLVLF